MTTVPHLSGGKQAFAFIPGVEGGLVASQYYRFSMEFRRFSRSEVTVTVEISGFAVITGIPLLVSLFRDSGNPELAALADLVTAHEGEYSDLVASEQVLKALEG